MHPACFDILQAAFQGRFQCGFIGLGIHREQFGGKQRFVVRVQMRDCRFYFPQGVLIPSPVPIIAFAVPILKPLLSDLLTADLLGTPARLRMLSP